MRRALLVALALAQACATGVATRPAVPAPAAAATPAPDRFQVPALGPPAPLRLPPQIRFELPNGLRVRLVEYHRLPIVALNLVVDAGAAQDPPDRPGLASLTAGMLTEGTTTRSSTRISDELGSLGAHLGAGAGFDAAQLSASSLSRHLDRLLDLFADVLVHPSFPAQDFARVQDQRIVSLVQQRDQPGAVASKAFGPLYWGAHPYGHWIGGTEESLRVLDPAALRAFHAARWRPGNAELVVVGDVTRAELEPMLARALAGWSGKAPAPGPRPAPQRPAARTVLVEKKGAPQSFVLLGTPGFPRADPDQPAADVAFEILGGGTASRLFRHLREEKGYTYGMSARPESRRLGGVAVVGGSVKAEQTGEALRALLGELEALREQPVTAEELSGAKDGIVRGLPGDFATAGGIAGRLAESVVHGLPDDYWARYAKAIQRVGAEDVQRAARRWLDLSRITAVLVADPGVVAPQLGGLPMGPLEVRAPAGGGAGAAAGAGAVR
jgi:predicted Zn-dependent peptidase